MSDTEQAPVCGSSSVAERTSDDGKSTAEEVATTTSAADDSEPETEAGTASTATDGLADTLGNITIGTSPSAAAKGKSIAQPAGTIKGTITYFTNQEHVFKELMEYIGPHADSCPDDGTVDWDAKKCVRCYSFSPTSRDGPININTCADTDASVFVAVDTADRRSLLRVKQTEGEENGKITAMRLSGDDAPSRESSVAEFSIDFKKGERGVIESQRLDKALQAAKAETEADTAETTIARQAVNDVLSVAGSNDVASQLTKRRQRVFNVRASLRGMQSPSE